MGISTSQLGKSILVAFKGVLSEKWPDIKEYGEAESSKLARTLVMIEALTASGKINSEQAKLHMDIQKNSTRIVLLTLEGLGILAVEAALNAALDAVKEAVNAAVGFALI